LTRTAIEKYVPDNLYTLVDHNWKQISQFVSNDNTFVPESLILGHFVQFLADNLDVLEETFRWEGNLPRHTDGDPPERTRTLGGGNKN
jgi:hypothetical protein